MNNLIKLEKLEPVLGSSMCQFSVIENKLAALYRNQRRMYFLLKIIAKLLGAKIQNIEPVKQMFELTWDERD